MRLRDPPRISFRGISSFYSFSVIRSDLPEIYSGYIFVYPVHPITLHGVAGINSSQGMRRTFWSPVEAVCPPQNLRSAAYIFPWYFFILFLFRHPVRSPGNILRLYLRISRPSYHLTWRSRHQFEPGDEKNLLEPSGSRLPTSEAQKAPPVKTRPRRGSRIGLHNLKGRSRKVSSWEELSMVSSAASDSLPTPTS